MGLSSSPKLEEYQDGIPPEKPDRKGQVLAVRILIGVFALVSVVLLLSQVLSSNTTALLAGKGQVVGVVVDETGAPLQGEVFISGYDHEVETKVDGSFEISGVPEGEQMLAVAHHGAASQYPVEVVAGQTVDMGEIRYFIVTPVAPEP